MTRSYGAMQEVFMFLTPLQVLSFQATCHYMYRVGVSRCQHFVNLTYYPNPIIFSSYFDNALYTVSGFDNFVCRRIENAAFKFEKTHTMQVGYDKIICIYEEGKTVQRISAIQSDNPKIEQLQDRPCERESEQLFHFALANYHNKLVILTGGRDGDRWRTKSAYALELATGIWKPKDTLPCMNIFRFDHSSCAIGDAIYVVAGTRFDQNCRMITKSDWITGPVLKTIEKLEMRLNDDLSIASIS